MTLNFYTLGVLYLVYSFLGWVGETVVATFRGKRFANRGMAAGPFCFVYGTTAILMAVGFADMRTKPVALFVACMLTATVVEWLTAKLLERLHNRKWWDYSDKKFNLNGYVCLQYSVLWGALGMVTVLWGNGLLLRLFDYLGDGAAYHSSRVELGRNTEDLIFLHITHLLEDTHGRMTRSALEQALNYSGNYLNSVVVRHTGLCLFDYGMQYCMDYARQLLTTTDLTVQQIAAELNFTNRTHFYKLFAEHTGMTPRQYRLKNRPEQP